MRLLYEINADLDALLSQVDEETGELTCSMEDIDALMLERTDAIEGLAVTIKNKIAEAKAIADEIKVLTERMDRLERHADKLRDFLRETLAGEKFSSPKAQITYRRSEAVEIRDPDFALYADAKYLRVKTDINRTAIKDALKNGVVVPGAELVTRQNMIIK